MISARQLVGLVLLIMVPACGRHASAQANSNSRLVSYDPRTNTATFELAAGAPGSNGPFNFDGYTSGGATLVVPPKSTGVMNFVNDDATPHSAEIIPDADPMPNMGVDDPAIPGAYTDNLTQGLPQGGKDVMRFTAPDRGSFRIFCGVPGHGLSGMWIRFRVDPAAKAPSLVTGS
jgi:hypothetical protein